MSAPVRGSRISDFQGRYRGLPAASGIGHNAVQRISTRGDSRRRTVAGATHLVCPTTRFGRGRDARRGENFAPDR
jgi:hypothetical protein